MSHSHSGRSMGGKAPSSMDGSRSVYSDRHGRLPQHVENRMILDSLPIKSRREDNTCNQLFTRVTGSALIFLGVLLMVVTAVILAIPCCGSHWADDSDSNECKSIADDSAFRNEDEGKNSCYHRNIVALVSGLFALFLSATGTLFIVIGECFYDTDDEKEDDKVQKFANHMRLLEMQRVQEDRLDKVEAKEERRIARDIARSERSEMRSADLERTRRMDIGRRYSIGDPNTPSDRQVVASAPYLYGRAQPYHNYNQQPHAVL